MPRLTRFDHVGITVTDLDAAAAFFLTLGLEVEGRTFLEGDFLDTVIGIDDARTEILVLRPPGGGTGVELARFIRPAATPGQPTAMAPALGLRSIVFEVDDLATLTATLAAAGYPQVGGTATHQNAWHMTSIRGPEGIIVSLAERVDCVDGRADIA